MVHTYTYECQQGRLKTQEPVSTIALPAHKQCSRLGQRDIQYYYEADFWWESDWLSLWIPCIIPSNPLKQTYEKFPLSPKQQIPDSQAVRLAPAKTFPKMFPKTCAVFADTGKLSTYHINISCRVNVCYYAFQVAEQNRSVYKNHLFAKPAQIQSICFHYERTATRLLPVVSMHAYMKWGSQLSQRGSWTPQDVPDPSSLLLP